MHSCPQCLGGVFSNPPPGGPNLVRLIATSLLQGLRTRQEATSVVITCTLRNPAVIIPTQRDLAGITMIIIQLSLSPRKKRRGNPEQPRVVESQAPPLLDTDTHLLLAGKAQSVPQSGWHSVLELLLPNFHRPPRVLAHFSQTLCQLCLVQMGMSLKLRAVVEMTVSTTTSLAGDPEDP